MIRSGQVTVTVAGTAVQASADNSMRHYLLRARAANTGDIYIGNNGSGDVDANNSLTLGKSDPPIRFYGRLSELWVDAATGGDKLCWFVAAE